MLLNIAAKYSQSLITSTSEESHVFKHILVFFLLFFFLQDMLFTFINMSVLYETE